MIFPSPSAFVAMGLPPGELVIDFKPHRKDTEVLKVSRDGNDIAVSGLRGDAGEKIENVLIVVGKPRGELK
jgi:hypothetical protein